MASRRSRLQIKPNIGGPKGSGSKPAPKTVDPKPALTENPIVSVPKLTNNPRKCATVIPCNLKETDQEKQIQNKPDSAVNKEAQKTKLTDSKIILDSGPGINRLTKISPSGTNDSNNEKGKSSSTSLETNNAKEYLEKDGRKINAKPDSNHVLKEEGSSSSQDLIKEQHTDTAKSTIPPRRSRFPKVTPNVVDASKKRQRNTTIPVETSENTCICNAIRTFDEKEKERSDTRKVVSAKFPEEEMVIVNEDEILPACFTDIDGSTSQETDRTMSPQPFIPPRSPVKAPSGNLSFTASPIKQPQVNVSRTRTVSTSEAPVIKKPRRTKIDIPTDRPPDRTTVRMKDLIHWNPSNNPIKPKAKLTKKVLDGEKENASGEKKPQLPINNDIRQSKDNVEDDNEDDGADDMDNNKDNPEDEVDSAMPVPQVTIGPDGNIIINEKSLVVEDKSIEKAPNQDDNVIDETENTTTYASFRPRPSFKRWNKKETMKFYKALAMIGADFFLIQKVFPNRTRMEIKRKFKREEKINSSLVEKVLKEGIHFDKSFLEQGENSESSDEEVKKERKPKREKVAPKENKPKRKYNRASAYSRNYMYFEPKSDTEDEEEEEETGVENEKDDTTWQPPQSLNDLNVGKRESTSSSRRVVLSQEQKRRVDMTKEEDARKEIYRAVRLYPKYSPSSYPKISPSSTEDDVPIPDKDRDDTQVLSSQPSQLPLLTVNNNGESVTYSNLNDNHTTNLANAINSAMLPECPNMSNASIGNTPVQQSERNPQYMAQHLTQIMPDFSNLSQLNNGVAANNMRALTAPPGTLLQNVVMDNSDQYVLVTVVPEGNEETVIHIYKIPGGPVPSELGSSAEPR